MVLRNESRHLIVNNDLALNILKELPVRHGDTSCSCYLQILDLLDSAHLTKAYE